MRATWILLGAVLLLGMEPSRTQANPWFGHRQAPDACGPGYYSTHPCGMVYGPNYWLTPPHPPFNGLLPRPQGAPSYPVHPYARSPRDFFMVYDNWYDPWLIRAR